MKIKLKLRKSQLQKINPSNIKKGDTIFCVKDLVMDVGRNIEARKGSYYVVTNTDHVDEFTFWNESGNRDHYIKYENNEWFKKPIENKNKD